MRKIIIKTKNKGYALMFTVIIVGIISLIAIGLSNSATKQLILTSLAKDSTVAFYQADLASECAFFADYQYRMNPSSPWLCSGQELFLTKSEGNPISTYELNPSEELASSGQKCFRIVVTKENTGERINTKIVAQGYNICDKSNRRTVERALEANY